METFSNLSRVVVMLPLICQVAAQPIRAPSAKTLEPCDCVELAGKNNVRAD